MRKIITWLRMLGTPKATTPKTITSYAAAGIVTCVQWIRQ